MKTGNFPKDIQFASNIQKINIFAIRRVEKRHSVASPIPNPIKHPPRVALCLFQNILCANRYFFGFNNTQKPSFDKQGIISRAIGCKIFLNCMALQRGSIQPISIFDNLPIERLQLSINSLFSGFRLRFLAHLCLLF
jgi:hypothetical protein